MDTLFFHIVAIRSETTTVKTFVLALEEGQTISYPAGQFLTFLFQVNGEEIRRSYSISSAPVLPELISITTKRYPNGAISRFMHDILQVGDRVEALLPAGKFTIAPEPQLERDIF